MKMNMSSSDRLVRLLIVALIAVLFFTNTVTGLFGYVLLAVAAIFLLTSLIGSCPLYSLFGISTCKVKKQG
jgi:hypothetical protein